MFGDVDGATLCHEEPCHDALLRLGLPMTAARAVICGIRLVEKHRAMPTLVAGRLCALMSPRDSSVRVVTGIASFVAQKLRV